MKRSERKSSSKKRLEEVILVLDENLSGESIYTALKEAGLPVRQQTDYVPRGATDQQLLEGLISHPNFVLVTKDRDFRYKQHLVECMRIARFRVFALTAAGNKRGEEIVSQILDAWPSMQRFLKKNPAPFVAKVSSNATITITNK